MEKLRTDSIPPLSDEPDANLGIYQHEPLPTLTSIRLLEILPSEPPLIRCTLRTVDLEDGPIFDALSYTWGNPITIYEKLDIGLPGPDDLLPEGAVESSREGVDKKVALIDLDALLYRAKHPYIPYEKVDWTAEKCHPIECDGRTIMVTENLLWALVFFHRMIQGDRACIADEIFEGFTDKPCSKLFWIDAICINQENVVEKGLQVSLMSRIFKEAQNVFGWLGPSDSFSKTGLHVLTKISELLVRDRNLRAKFNGSLYGLPGLDIAEVEWLSVFALLQRLWFRRAWIAQEAVFARQLVMICGSVLSRWTGLETAIMFLGETGLDTKIYELVRNLMCGGPSEKFMRKLHLAGCIMTGFTSHKPGQQLPHLEVDPRSAYTFVRAVSQARLQLGMPTDFLYATENMKRDGGAAEREKAEKEETELPEAESLPQRAQNKWPNLEPEVAGLGEQCGQSVNFMQGKDQETLLSTLRDESGRLDLSQLDPSILKPVRLGVTRLGLREPTPTSLLSMLSAFRVCGASNPRDKVFAFLNMAVSSHPHVGSVHKIEPDYRASVQEVFIQTARVILHLSRSLAILSNVQDPSLTRIDNLPSWVPDFSVDVGHSVLGSEVSSPWSAYGGVCEQSFSITPQLRLITKGVRVDTVSCIAASDGCYYLRTAELVLGTPGWYLDRTPTLIGYRTEKDRDPVCFPLPKEFGSPAVRRVEALWRTLVADTFEGKCPAPIRCGFGFSDWLCVHIHRALKLHIIIERSLSTIGGKTYGSLDDAKRKLEQKIGIWSRLGADEIGGFYALPELTLVKETLRESLEHHEQIRQTTFSGHDTIDLEDGGFRFLPDEKRLRVFVNDEEWISGGIQRISSTPLDEEDDARMASFEARMREVAASRRMFKTTKNYFGMGPKSTQVGDQVWLLCGANVPFVLRRVGDACYRLVGESYVHGIMHGEAISEGHTEFEEIGLS